MRGSKFFNKKVVIITGSSRGLGRATAYALAEAGALIVLNGRNIERLEQTRKEMKKKGHQVLSIPGDVTSPEDSRNLIEKARAQTGRIDVLINNAGTIMRAGFEEIKPDIFRKVIEGNILGSAYPSMFALPHLKQTGGSVFFISSLAGLHGMPAASAYSAAKMALTGLVESIRIELTGTGVHAGIIYVGFVENDPDKRVYSADGSLIQVDPPFQSPQKKVARSIMKCIAKKKYKTALSIPGKLARTGFRLAPGLADFLLKFSYKNIPKFYR
ncbi:MAG TPA: SDR family oxidoreductase [Spirochaetes bacterium]|nr:SDR family oxidoreductase [Spirochaetota bacterium]